MANEQQFWIDTFEMVDHACLTFYHAPVFEDSLEKLNIRYNIEIGIDESHPGLIVVGTSIELWVPDTEKSKLIIRSSDQFKYIIRDLDAKIKEKPDSQQKYIDDHYIVASIIGLAFSTLRGILIQKLKGTTYQHVILPPFNAFKMAENIMKEQSAQFYSAL